MGYNPVVKLPLIYDFVRERPEDQIDYSMDVNQANTQGIHLDAAFFSNTLTLFHGVILASIIVVMVFIV